MIERAGKKWLLVTRRGVYEHDTRGEAEAQEIAIRIAKARRAGHRIPGPASTRRPQGSRRLHRRGVARKVTRKVRVRA